MLEYEWGNPSPVILPENDDDPVHAHHHSDHAHHHQFFDPYSHAFNDGALFSPAAAGAFSHHHHHQAQQQAQQQAHFHPFYDPRYYASSSASFPPPPPPPPPQQAAMLGLDAASGGGGYMLVPKSEEDMSSQPPPPLDFTARLGLNLGGRTYFSAADEDFVSRLYRRSSSGRPGEASAGIGLGNSPRCQAEGCGADLTHSKHYHRRHKVCEYHSKAASVVAAGLTQRFCQQCSRFHLLSEFDNGKRSCRKRLADHNRRRRKSQQQPNQDHPKPLELDSGGGRSSSSYGFARSPSESGGQYSSSSVTIAVSPPRMSLDSFRGRPYRGTSSASSSLSSIFFSSG